MSANYISIQDATEATEIRATNGIKNRASQTYIVPAEQSNNRKITNNRNGDRDAHSKIKIHSVLEQ